MKDIEFVSTDDLITELMHRYDHTVFAAIAISTEREYKTLRRFYGNAATCNGLCSELQFLINTDTMENSDVTQDRDIE